MIRSLLPYSSNTKKRLVKSPKLYLRDSGLLHQLLGIENFDQLMGHPISGPSWEGYAIENILSEMKSWESFFYRTKNGVELDLILSKGGKKYGLEFKLSSSPKIEKGNHLAREDLDLEHIHIITPEGHGDQINPHTFIDSPLTFLEKVL